MSPILSFNRIVSQAGIALLAILGVVQVASGAQPYKIVNTVQVLGTGSIDYVYADNDGGQLYVPRGNQILVFSLDTLKSVGSITNARARGAAVDPKSHHGFSSSSPVVMWDTKTLETIKTIEVKGRPDGIVFEPLTERIYVLSHTQPNATIIDAKDGAVVGTIDLGGAPEQAVSDGQGHLYVNLEDASNVAVVDVKSLQVTAHYSFDGKGGTPTGLALDAKNRILFSFCRNPAAAVILSADDGKILGALPIGKGTDAGAFNPSTQEAFSSQGDGTLTIIKENSPTSFEVEQTVQTKPRAKTCTLDTRKNQIVLITTEPAPTPPPEKDATAATPPAGANQPGSARRSAGGPALLDILVVGR
jgi:DNA-binding beta-propeller fold protein YncE